YKATQGDLSKLNRADIVVYNGLYLEGKMGEILEKLARQKPVLAAAESIPDSLIRSSEFYDNSPDPHVWFDVTLWKHVVDAISNKMQEIDSTHKAYYALNTDQYLQLLDTLHLYAQNQIGSIPDQQRILVTAHDAFGYFGEAYSIQVKGLQGISTVSEFGLRDIAEISDLIIDNGVKSIFVETSVSDRAIKAVINGCREKGHDVTVGGSLFSDAMGEIGTFEGTYIGMVKTNVDTITEALK
ncbi:MAG: zinc ABC transporter substrate-binding protein, partial [Cyclobacteriaceae bacterium]|nr:zinc ABC transporter substrate-binding protein [Cyclobacteriaceae bacterium HetDA_MAG_MS6]